MADIQTAEIKYIGTESTQQLISNVRNEISNAIKNIEIGGRNLITLDSLGNLYFTMTAASTNDIELTNVPSGNYACLKILSEYEAGTYTFNAIGSISNHSFRLLSSTQISGFTYNSYYESSYGMAYYKDIITPRVITLTDTTALGLIMISDHGNQKISGLKLEKGNKATDWTPAPEDIDTAINNIPSLPEVSSTEEGMFLRVVNSEAVWSAVPNAEEASF